MSTTIPNQPFRFSTEAVEQFGGGTRTKSQIGSAEENLLRETRKELRRIVADVSSLCHSRIEPDKFWAKFLSLVGTALAAEAGIVWRRDAIQETVSAAPDARLTGQTGNIWRHVAFCGALDHRLLTQNAATCHELMIREIGDSGGPVAVPPGANWTSEEPGNPSDLLATVVPVPIDPDEPVQWLVEFFLTPGGGPAVQRGYLRFLAQMTDLAAEYMRAERLRAMSRGADFSHRAALMLASLQDKVSASNFFNVAVDAVAQFASADRVSLVRFSNQRPTVVAVNGTTTIDRFSPVIKAIAETAAEAEGVEGIVLAEPCNSTEDADNLIDSTEGEEVLRSGTLMLRGVVILGDATRCRLIIEDQHPHLTSADETERWNVLAKQLTGLFSFHLQQTQSGVSRLLTRKLDGQPSVLRRGLVPLGLSVVCLIVAMLPAPLIISAQGHLQPSTMQTLYAPRSAVVSELYVVHDQPVNAGQPILKLEDQQLDQQIEQINSRLAILTEEAHTVRDEQARVNSRDMRFLKELALRQKSIDEEIRSLENQLKTCKEIQQGLTLHAECRGRVDAWQLESNLQRRPVDRGQALMRIIPENVSWQVHAKVPQNRLDHLLSLIQRRQADGLPVPSQVVVSAFPDTKLQAYFSELGPVSSDDSSGSVMDQHASALATFEIESSQLPLRQCGAPVTLTIGCGSRPLAYVLGQDLIRLAVQTFHLYR